MSFVCLFVLHGKQSDILGAGVDGRASRVLLGALHVLEWQNTCVPDPRTQHNVVLRHKERHVVPQCGVHVNVHVHSTGCTHAGDDARRPRKTYSEVDVVAGHARQAARGQDKLPGVLCGAVYDGGEHCSVGDGRQQLSSSHASKGVALVGSDEAPPLCVRHDAKPAMVILNMMSVGTVVIRQTCALCLRPQFSQSGRA